MSMTNSFLKYGLPILLVVSLAAYFAANATDFSSNGHGHVPTGGESTTPEPAQASVDSEEFVLGGELYTDKTTSNFKWGLKLEDTVNPQLEDNFSRIAKIIGSSGTSGEVTQVTVDLKEGGKIEKIVFFVDINGDKDPDYTYEVSDTGYSTDKLEYKPYSSKASTSVEDLRLTVENKKKLAAELRLIGQEITQTLKQQKILVPDGGGTKFHFQQSIALKQADSQREPV